MSEFERVVIREMMEFFQFSNMTDDFSGTITFRIKVSTDEEEIWTVRIHNSDPVQIISGLPDDGDISCECSLSFDTFYGLYSNTLDPTSAVLSGKVQVRYWRYAQLSRIMGTFDFSSEKWDEFYSITGKTPKTLADRDQINLSSGAPVVSAEELMERKYMKFQQLTRHIGPNDIETIMKLVGIDDEFLSIELPPPETPPSDPQTQSQSSITGQTSSQNSSPSTDDPVRLAANADALDTPRDQTQGESTMAMSGDTNVTGSSLLSALPLDIVSHHAKYALLPDSSPITPLNAGDAASEDEIILNENGLTPTQQRITDLYTQTVQMMKPLVKTIAETDPSSISTAVLSIMPTIQQVQQDLIQQRQQQQQQQQQQQSQGQGHHDNHSHQSHHAQHHNHNQQHHDEDVDPLQPPPQSSTLIHRFLPSIDRLKDQYTKATTSLRARLAMQVLRYLPINTLHAMNYITSEHYLHYAAVWNSLGNDAPSPPHHDPSPSHMQTDNNLIEPILLQLYMGQPPLHDPSPLNILDPDFVLASQINQQEPPVPSHHPSTSMSSSSSFNTSSQSASQSNHPDLSLPPVLTTLLDVPPLVEPVPQRSPMNALARFHQTRLQLASQLKELQIKESTRLPSPHMSEDVVYDDYDHSTTTMHSFDTAKTNHDGESIEPRSDYTPDSGKDAISTLKERLMQLQKPPEVFKLKKPQFPPPFQHIFNTSSSSSSSSSPSHHSSHISHSDRHHSPQTPHTITHIPPTPSPFPPISEDRIKRSQQIQEALDQRSSRRLPFIRQNQSKLSLEGVLSGHSSDDGDAGTAHAGAASSPDRDGNNHASDANHHHHPSDHTDTHRKHQPPQRLPFSNPMDDLDADVVNTFLKLMVQNIMNNPKRYGGEFNVLTTPTELTQPVVLEMVDDFNHYRSSVKMNISEPFNTTKTPMSTKQSQLLQSLSKPASRGGSDHSQRGESLGMSDPTDTQSGGDAMPSHGNVVDTAVATSTETAEVPGKETIHELLFHNVSTLSIACSKERVFTTLRKNIAVMHDEQQKKSDKHKKGSHHGEEIIHSSEGSTTRDQDTQDLLHRLYSSTKGYLWDSTAGKFYYYDDEAGGYYHVDEEDDAFILSNYYRTKHSEDSPLPLLRDHQHDEDHAAEYTAIIEQSPYRKEYQYQYKRLPPLFAFFNYHFNRVRQLTTSSPSLFSASHPSKPSVSIPSATSIQSSVSSPSPSPSPPDDIDTHTAQYHQEITENDDHSTSPNPIQQPTLDQVSPSSPSEANDSKPGDPSLSPSPSHTPITLQHPIDIYLYTPVTSLSLLLNGSLETPTIETTLTAVIKAYSQQRVTPEPARTLSIFTPSSDYKLENHHDGDTDHGHDEAAPHDLLSPLQYIHDFNYNQGYPLDSSVFIVAKHFSDHGVKIQLGKDFCLSDEDREAIQAYKKYRTKQLLLKRKQEQMELQRFRHYQNELRKHGTWVKSLLSLNTKELDRSDDGTTVTVIDESIDTESNPTGDDDDATHDQHGQYHDEPLSSTDRTGAHHIHPSSPHSQSNDTETTQHPGNSETAVNGGGDDSYLSQIYNALATPLAYLPSIWVWDGDAKQAGDANDTHHDGKHTSDHGDAAHGATGGAGDNDDDDDELKDCITEKEKTGYHRYSVQSDNIFVHYNSLMGMLASDFKVIRESITKEKVKEKTRQIKEIYTDLMRKQLDNLGKVYDRRTASYFNLVSPTPVDPGCSTPAMQTDDSGAIDPTVIDSSVDLPCTLSKDTKTSSIDFSAMIPPSPPQPSSLSSLPTLPSTTDVETTTTQPQPQPQTQLSSALHSTKPNRTFFSTLLHKTLGNHLSPSLQSFISSTHTPPPPHPMDGESFSPHNEYHPLDSIDLSLSDDVIDSIASRIVDASCERHHLDNTFSLYRKRLLKRERLRQQIRDRRDQNRLEAINKSKQLRQSTSAPFPDSSPPQYHNNTRNGGGGGGSTTNNQDGPHGTTNSDNNSNNNNNNNNNNVHNNNNNNALRDLSPMASRTHQALNAYRRPSKFDPERETPQQVQPTSTSSSPSPAFHNHHHP